MFKKNKINIVSTSYNLEKQIVSELKKAVNPKNIKPNEDFYSYINDRWISDYELTESQKYIVQVDDFRITQDKVYRELIEIIEEYLSEPSNANSKKYKCIKTAYKSFNIYNTTEQTRCLSKTYLDYIDALIADKSNIWKKLGLLNKDEITCWGSPFVWSLNPDEKNPKIYKCYLDAPQLSLIDTDIYFDDDFDKEDIKKYKLNYRREYFKYLNNLFTIAYGENHGFNVKDVFDTEFEILNAMACDLIKETDADNYNLITKDEALKDFGFNWSEFCKYLGFQKTPESFITSNVNYLLCGTKLLLEKWNSPQWRTYWVYLYIRQQCRWNKAGQKNFFEFQGNFVKGQEINIDMTIAPIFPMGFLFNTFLTNEYIKKYKNDKLINYVKGIAEDLKIVFTRIIRRNNWMKEKTKQKALEKLEKLKLIVGSPQILRDDPLLDYKDNDPWVI
jgi:predicted metalloendopeptidase